jgi:hypothetical protein
MQYAQIASNLTLRKPAFKKPYLSVLDVFWKEINSANMYVALGAYTP